MKNRLLILVLVICIVLLNFASASLIDNLVPYYKLDETSGNVINSHGTNNGTNNGATRGVTGKINNAFDFDGAANDYVQVDNSFDFVDSLTINTWVKSSSISDYMSVVVQDWGDNWIFIHSYGSGARSFVYTASGKTSTQGNSSITDANWHMVTTTYDKSLASQRLKVYVDGNKEQWADGYNEDLNDAVGNLLLASRYKTSKGGWNGIIDEVGIWNRSLSSSEISLLYNSGDGLAYPFVADTCSCPGAGNNWEIDMSDYCNITEDCDLTTGKLSFIGSGETRINATIHTTDLGDPGTNGILKILLNCWIWDY